MTKTIMKLENVSLTIDKLKALTKNDEESMVVFRDCQLDVDKITTYLDDVICGLQEVHSIIYNHKADKVYIENLKKCKDYYYNTGHLGWEADSFIDATYEMFDVTIQNAGEGMKSIFEEVFGEGFMDLFSTQDDSQHEFEQHIKGDLWNFIKEDDDTLYEAFLSAFADNLDELKQMLDDYTVKLVNVHKYVYGYNHSQFKTVYGDNIAMIKCCYFENRHKTDLLRNTDFMGAINFLDETIEKKLLSCESILKLVDILFEDEFEGLTDFDLELNGKTKHDYDELKDEYFDFHKSVEEFHLDLNDLLACGNYCIESKEYELLYQIAELFDKHVKL
ncbi:hypothetical protein [Lysinibacillus agricola]|uniref:hypothetical protein n=1 Tax=Lysinibacillus agricola TaxID=2590012 RepID=UPI003C15D9EA